MSLPACALAQQKADLKPSLDLRSRPCLRPLQPAGGTIPAMGPTTLAPFCRGLATKHTHSWWRNRPRDCRPSLSALLPRESSRRTPAAEHTGPISNWRPEERLEMVGTIREYSDRHPVLIVFIAALALIAIVACGSDEPAAPLATVAPTSAQRSHSHPGADRADRCRPHRSAS